VARPVVHFEIMARDMDKLSRYYSELFGWEINTDNPVRYKTVDRAANVGPDGVGIGGGIGAAPDGYDGPRHLRRGRGGRAQAESLGGSRMMGAEKVGDEIEIGLFNDPEGHLVGVVRTS